MFIRSFLDHIDNHWLRRQNSSYLAWKVAFCRICATWHFFLCTTCCEYAYKICKNVIEISVAPPAVTIQKAEGSWRLLCDNTRELLSKIQRKGLGSLLEFCGVSLAWTKLGNNPKLGSILLYNVEIPFFCYELWLIYYCFSFRFLKKNQLTCFSELDSIEKNSEIFLIGCLVWPCSGYQQRVAEGIKSTKS